MHKRLRMAVAGMLLTLTGCSAITGGGQPYPERYMLSVPESAAANTSHRFPVTLRVAPVSAPTWLSSSRMLYQLEYQQQNQLAAYTRSRWAEPPAGMVGHALEQALSDSGLFRAVTSSDIATAGLVLQINLSDFSQQFTSLKQSYGLLDVQATLIQAATNQVLAQRAFQYRVPAASADAAGGVRALNRATRQLDGALKRWITATITQCAPGCLRATAD